MEARKKSMKKNWLTILLCLVVFAIAIVLITKVILNTDGNNDAKQSTPSALVEILAEGFSPPAVATAAGQSVTWTNNDSKPHELQLNGNNVQGFNSGVIDPGESYTFTFNQKGTYNYKDVLGSSDLQGTVTVE